MRTIEVRCKTCNKYFDESQVEFVNIEEGYDGADVLTFVCPECGQEQTSKRYSGHGNSMRAMRMRYA